MYLVSFLPRSNRHCCFVSVAVPGQALCGQLNPLRVWRVGPPPPTHSSSNGGLRQLRRAGPGLRELRRRKRVSFCSALQLHCVPQKQNPTGPSPCFPLLFFLSLSAGRLGPVAPPALCFQSGPGRGEGRPFRMAGKHRRPRANRLTISRGLAAYRQSNRRTHVAGIVL